MRLCGKKEEDEGVIGSGEWGIWPKQGPFGIKLAGRTPVTEDKIKIN
jgi:hypothetical protein